MRVSGISPGKQMGPERYFSALAEKQKNFAKWLLRKT